MIVYHVTSFKKLMRYYRQGCILPPVRAWTDIYEAIRFSIQTGRPIIIRLKFPDDAQRLIGHNGKAVISNSPIQIENLLGKPK